MTDISQMDKPEGDPNDYTNEQIALEIQRLTMYGVDSFIYYLRNYMKIQSNEANKWIHFELWDTDCSPYDNQYDLAREMATNKYVCCLKSRQVGATWIALGLSSWLSLFFSPNYSLFLSKGEEEGKALKKRMEKVLELLPDWLRPTLAVNNKLEIEFESDDSYMQFGNPRSGDSRTFNIVVVDEADLIYRSKTSLRQTILNVEPTIGVSGQLILISKSDKNRPSSTFKSIYKAASRRRNRFKPLFVPWKINPSRTEEWYAMQTEMSLSIDGTLDTLHESYPSHPAEALRGKTANKRLPYYIMIVTGKR